MRDIDEDDDTHTPLLETEDPQVVIVANQSDSDSASARTPRRSGSTSERFRRNRSSARLPGTRRTPSVLNKSSTDVADRASEGGDVAFTIVVNRQEEDDADDKSQPEQDEANRTEVDFMQEAVQEAITEAVQDAVQEVVQDTVVEAVQDAVTAAFEENGRFDVRANFYTLIAITGVILYWRGIWNSWDYFFGLSIWSEAASVVTGLVVMLTMRYLQVPLVESLPGG